MPLSLVRARLAGIFGARGTYDDAAVQSFKV